MDEKPLLSGWKEIADFIKRNVQTAQTYEKDGMPVFRVRGRVYACKVELLAWFQDEETRE